METLIHNIIYLYIPVMIIPLSIYKIYRLTHRAPYDSENQAPSPFLFPIQ